MRITFILPTPNLSGGMRVVSIYARLLASKGHCVTLVSQPPATIAFRRKIKSILLGRGWPRAAAAGSHLDGLAVEHRVLETRRPPTDADVPDGDVVVATWWETAEWVDALSWTKGAKVYFVQGHEVFPHLAVARVEASYRLPLRKLVVARWLQDVMRERYGDPSAVVIPNAVDHAQFHSPPRGRQARPTIGFLFSLKGLDVALNVLKAMHQRHPDLRILSFGSKPLSVSLPRDLEIQLTVAPPQDEIRDIYAQCDVWLSTSRSEGFNLMAMEAMACRTPVVATRTGWPAEAVIDAWNGALADVDDVPGLIFGLDMVLGATDEAWQEMSAHAFDTVASSSWEQSTIRLEQALSDAVRDSATKLG